MNEKGTLKILVVGRDYKEFFAEYADAFCTSTKHWRVSDLHREPDKHRMRCSKVNMEGCVVPLELHSGQISLPVLNNKELSTVLRQRPAYNMIVIGQYDDREDLNTVSVRKWPLGKQSALIFGMPIAVADNDRLTLLSRKAHELLPYAWNQLRTK